MSEDCSDLDNPTFQAEQQMDEARGESFANGTLFHIDANGNTVIDGSYTFTPTMREGAITDLSGGQLMGIAGGRALEGVFGFVSSAASQFFGTGAGELAGDVAGSGAKVLVRRRKELGELSVEVHGEEERVKELEG